LEYSDRKRNLFNFCNKQQFQNLSINFRKAKIFLAIKLKRRTTSKWNYRIYFSASEIRFSTIRKQEDIFSFREKRRKAQQRKQSEFYPEKQL